MKKIMLAMFFFTSTVLYAQDISSEQWMKIVGEASNDYFSRGGNADGYTQNREKITNAYYKSHYTFDNSGRLIRREIAEANNAANSRREIDKANNTAPLSGKFYVGNYNVGSISNGVIYNVRSGNQAVGSFFNGRYSDNGNRCVGAINQNRIQDCQGKIIASVQNVAIMNSSNRLIFTIRGEYLKSAGT